MHLQGTYFHFICSLEPLPLDLFSESIVISDSFILTPFC